MKSVGEAHLDSVPSARFLLVNVRLGGRLGEITRYHFLQGLGKLLTYQSVVEFILTHPVSDEGFEEMVAFIS